MTKPALAVAAVWAAALWVLPTSFAETLPGELEVSTPAGPQPLLGAADSDLVYVPITPCRIFDTRLAGGVIAAGQSRGFDVTAVSDYTFQGGSAGDCNGAGAAGSFAAAAINLIAVDPQANGFLVAYPFGAVQPAASTMNFRTGVNLAHLAIVKLDQGASANEMTVYTSQQVHVVGDLVGYFINPQATALQCTDTASTIHSVDAGATANVTAPACPAGYTQTATNCEAGSWQMPIVYFHGGVCSAQNNSGGAAELRASRTCCRVFGR